MNGGREDRDDFYMHGTSRLSPRYWWRRRSEHRIIFALLVLAVMASPFAIAIWGPSVKAWSLEKYHAYQANRYSASAAAFFKKGDLESARIQFQNATTHCFHASIAPLVDESLGQFMGGTSVNSKHLAFRGERHLHGALRPVFYKVDKCTFHAVMTACWSLAP